MIKYIGSKRLLVPHIRRTVASLPGVSSVLDLFSGTSRVGYALKEDGFRVHANDHLAYAAALARCYVEADADEFAEPARRLIGELSRAPSVDGYFTEVFCRRSRFFQPRNGERVDGIREAIARLSLPPVLEAIALTSLMEAADRVDSTTGLQMAYLKSWSPRSHNDLELRVPRLLPGRGSSSALDAAEAAARIQVDLAYIDPPYNQHSYMGNYHIWETLVRWDEPEHYGVACKRLDCREYRSPFNRRREVRGAMEAVVDAARARHLVVSFSDEGFLSRRDLEEILGRRGPVRVETVDHRRYVGARIGIHDRRGRKVGRVGRLSNRERLFVVSCGAE